MCISKSVVPWYVEKIYSGELVMYQLKLGTSLSYADEHENPVVSPTFFTRLKELANLGFESIDFDITGCRTYRAALDLLPELNKGLQAILDAGLHINAIHLPFGPEMDLATLEETEREKVVQYMLALFRICDEFPLKAYIFHPGCETSAPRERAKAQLIKSLKDITGKTEKLLCMENLPRNCLANTAEETIEIVDSVKGINVCLDVNHFLQEKSENAILKIGQRIKTVHISDCDYINECHRLPGDGKINFMKVLAAFEEIGYNGVFNYEITMSWPNWVFYTYPQLKENYDRLFAEYNQKK
jgi:sugar phosphate isomerase/epimerase